MQSKTIGIFPSIGYLYAGINSHDCFCGHTYGTTQPTIGGHFFGVEGFFPDLCQYLSTGPVTIGIRCVGDPEYTCGANGYQAYYGGANSVYATNLKGRFNFHRKA